MPEPPQESTASARPGDITDREVMSRRAAARTWAIALGSMGGALVIWHMEVLVAEDEARHALEFDDMYIITPVFQWWGSDRWQEGKPLAEGFRFASETNSQWLSPVELRELIEKSSDG